MSTSHPHWYCFSAVIDYLIADPLKGQLQNGCCFMLADGSRSRFRAVNDRPYGMVHNLIMLSQGHLHTFSATSSYFQFGPVPGFPKGSKGLGGKKRIYIFYYTFFSNAELRKNPFTLSNGLLKPFNPFATLSKCFETLSFKGGGDNEFASLSHSIHYQPKSANSSRSILA